MNVPSILSTIVMAAALLIAPAYASDRPTLGTTPDDRMPPAQDEMPVKPEESGEAAPSLETTDGSLIQGRIAAVEPETGRFVLDTDEGPLSLVTSPSALVGVKVGDVVRVALTREPRAQ
jgi:hypothetical protein